MIVKFESDQTMIEKILDRKGMASFPDLREDDIQG
jgi:hypothetical protein